MKDERADAITFTANGPVHSHQGANVDLSSGCPDLYKYAYLTDRHPPFGSESDPNPLTFSIKTDLGSTQASASAYRVRDESGTILQDWTGMSPDASGQYKVPLYRDATALMAALGARTERMYFDARFHDIHGVETVETACWSNHPLAAPIDFAAAGSGNLFAMSFGSHSPISKLINALATDGSSYGPSVVTIPFRQSTAEAIHLSLKVPTVPTGTATKEIVNENLPTNQTASTMTCIGQCGTGGVPQRASATAQLGGTWQLSIIDDASGLAICHSSNVTTDMSCVIPGRATSEAVPHGYHATLSLSAEPAIAPNVTITPTSFTDGYLGSVWFTGFEPASWFHSCSREKRIGVTQNWSCLEEADFIPLTVVNQARIAFDAATFSITTNVGDSASVVVPAYIPAAATMFAAQTWDAGNAGF